MNVDLVAGARLADRRVSMDAVKMSAYAGVTWDWFQTHLDARAAVAAGFDDAIVDGQMIGALLAAHAQDGLGPRSRLVGLKFRHRAPVFRGDHLVVSGRIRSVGATVVVVQDVNVVDASGEPTRLAIDGAVSELVLK